MSSHKEPIDLKNTANLENTLKISAEHMAHSKQLVNSSDHKKFPIVAIGASAGGLEAHEIIFKYMPAKSGLPFVIITHLNPEQVNLLLELLQRHAKLPVVMIESGLKVEPDKVYVLPLGKKAMLQQGTLQLV